MEIPRRCILTTEDAQGSEIGRAITASGVHVGNSQSYLAAVLLDSRRSGTSFWHPYVAVLPPVFPTIPLFDDRVLELLKGSCALKMIDGQKQHLAEEYQRFRRLVPGFARFTYEEFLWARLAVSSRIFSLQTGGGRGDGLAPLAELLNHRTPPEAAWIFDDTAEVLRVTASQQIGTGTPIHHNYGAKCNSDFFVNCGFVLPDNDHNSATIALPPVVVERRYEGLLNRLCDRASDQACHFRVTADLRSAEKLLSFLRLAYANGDEQVSAPNIQEVRIMAISRGNETRALGALQQACTAALSAFDTSVTEDEAMLDSAFLSPNHRNAIMLRRGEKVVLHRYWKLAEIMLPLLRLPDTQLARILKAPPASTSGLSGYLYSLQPLTWASGGY